ncbi:pilus assembly protein [candidate division WOR-3 bacterium]|uniref:Pilus assembly protein n=1 Tax=candidate division WOR-3 bacterium TaxID=2052148 RepID=A0A937XDQ6_UNCW3|nr:pilus assembly protein [candidate division WOR-3 bacterium]
MGGARLRRLHRDTSGQALLETVVAFPVLLFFMLVVMELSLLYNAKQLANYAAFCAARTAAVNGVSATGKTHFAAAMAMSPLSSATNVNANEILLDYGLTNPTQTVAAICSIPGFQGDNDKWLARLANAYLRTGAPSFAVANYGTRKNVTANVTYVYRCSFWPFGIVWGQSAITTYYNSLPAIIKPFATFVNTWRWNIVIHGRAVTDYWSS